VSTTRFLLLAMLSSSSLSCGRVESARVDEYQSRPACDDYFPAGSFEGTSPQIAAFNRTWYGTPLAALNEPCLHDYTSSTATVSRLIWLPSFDPAVVVTVFSDPGGCWIWGDTLTLEWDLAADLTPTVHDVSIGDHLEVGTSKDVCDGIARLLEEAEFWSLPSVDPRPVHEDGAQWILQASRGTRYHFTDRSSPSDAYRDVYRYTFEVLGLPVERLDSY
jgi:hypothetical protein